MKYLLKKTSVLFLVVILCITALNFNPIKTVAATKKYLVTVEQKDGTWKSYTDLIEVSENGKLMIKAKAGAKALGLTYKNNKESFVIKIGNKQNTYTKNSKVYIYKNGSKSVEKTASNIAYTSKTSKSNVISIGSLSTLVNYKYYGSNEAKEYGYNGIIAYSSYNKIPTTVPTLPSTPKPTKEPTPEPTKEVTPEPIKEETKTASIKGVQFKIRNSFLKASDVGDDWGNMYDSLQEFKAKVDEGVTEDTILDVYGNLINFSHAGTSDTAISLETEGDGYIISIYVKLKGGSVAKENANVLKAFCYVISSTGSKLYDAIYDSWEGDEVYGINENSYVTIGDSKVKYKSGNGYGMYIIKPAK